MLRKLLLSAAIALLAAVSPATSWTHGQYVPPAGNTGGMLLNLANTAYYAGFNQILNWWKSGDTIVINSSVNGTLVGQAVWDCPTKCSTPTTYLDSDGELVTPVPADVIYMERGWWATVPMPQVNYAGTSFGQFASQVWKMKWTGCAAPNWTTSNLGTGGAMSGIGSNVATITFGSSGFQNVATRFTPDATCRANPPKAINIYQTEYSTDVAAAELWNPDFVNILRSWGYIRLMDVNWMNISGISDISQLADANYTHFGRYLANARSGGSSSISGGVLTINGWNGNQPFAVGQKIICIGCTGTITISSLGTGTGGNGNYNLAGASGITVSNQTMIGVPVPGQNGPYGPKAGWHPSLVCSLANKANVHVEYPVPASTTNQMMTDVATYFKGCLNTGLRFKVSYGNEWFNSAGAFDNYRIAAAYNANTPSVVDWPGYRAAQLNEIVANVYGTTTWNGRTNTTSRWQGTVSGQSAGPAVASSFIAGANAYIAIGPSAYTLQQLFNQVDVAPYWGFFINAATISGVSAAANPVVTANNDNGSGGKVITDGMVVKVFVNGGTMASVLNGTYATASATSLSGFTLSSFNGSVVSTVGLTYGGTNNGAFDAVTFRLVDQSKALNASTPATYPTKYSYFTQQMMRGALEQTVSDASYGTITYQSGLFAKPAVSGVAVTGSLLDYLQQNAIIAQKNGLDLSGYEGGPHGVYVGNSPGVIGSTANTGAIEAVEFFMMAQSFDAGVTGDTTNTPVGVYNTVFGQWNSVNGRYPAQFTDLSSQSQFGPWGALRFLAVKDVGGDTGNQKWQALLAQNALGPWVDPTPAPTGTVTRTPSDVNFGSGSSTTLTCQITMPSNGLAVLMIGWTNNTSNITSVNVSGVGNMTEDAFTKNAWSSANYSLPLSAGSYTATVTWGASAPFRNCAALAMSGLQSNAARSSTGSNTTNPQKNATISVTKGSFIVATATLAGAATWDQAAFGTKGVATGTVIQIDKQVPDGQAFGFAYWSPGPDFSSPLFNVQTNTANSMSVSTYK